MSKISIKELREMGVSQDDIETAKITQDAQRRMAGAKVLPLAAILGVTEPRKKRFNPNPPVSLTDRALRKRGTYYQAALLLDQQALQESSPERLFEVAPTTTKAKEALSILWTICRHLGWQSYECSKTATDLCEITRTQKPHMTDALKLLENVGAIRRVKKGRIKIITVTPEGAFRGNVNNHGKAVEKYKLDVIDGGKTDGP